MSIWSSRDDALAAWEVDYQPNCPLDIDLATAKSWNDCLRITPMGDGPGSTDAAFMVTVDQANALAAALWMWAAEQEGTAVRGMSRYTVTIVSNGGDWLLGRWYWTVSGPLASQDDDPDALFAFDLARGFAHSEKGARRKVGRRLARLRRERAAHLNRIVIEEPA